MTAINEVDVDVLISSSNPDPASDISSKEEVEHKVKDPATENAVCGLLLNGDQNSSAKVAKKEYCPTCSTGLLKYLYLDQERQIKMCINTKCSYPFESGNIEIRYQPSVLPLPRKYISGKVQKQGKPRKFYK